MELKKISDIKLNPNNPRLIKDDKFKKLVQSIKDFPEMLNIRPIVVNKDMIILGGNMRYRACKEAGIKEIPVIITDLSEEKQREFLIKDNTSGGEWDWNMLANEWEEDQLNEWGIDIPNWSLGLSENDMSEFDLDMNEEFDTMGIKSDMKNVTFVFNSENDAKSYCENNGFKIVIKGELWKVEIDSQFI